MGYDQGKIDNWAADAEDGQMYKDTLNEIAGAVRNMTVDYKNLDSAMDTMPVGRKTTRKGKMI